MIAYETRLGTIDISDNYLAKLIGGAVSSCYGVVGIAAKTPVQGLMRYISGKSDPAQGVKVKNIGNKLVIDIHIVVLYGVNVSAIVSSIIEKVRYSVSSAVGLHVAKVNVYVDKMTAE